MKVYFNSISYFYSIPEQWICSLWSTCFLLQILQWDGKTFADVNVSAYSLFPTHVHEYFCVQYLD